MSNKLEDSITSYLETMRGKLVTVGQLQFALKPRGGKAPSGMTLRKYVRAMGGLKVQGGWFIPVTTDSVARRGR